MLTYLDVLDTVYDAIIIVVDPIASRLKTAVLTGHSRPVPIPDVQIALLEKTLESHKDDPEKLRKDRDSAEAAYRTFVKEYGGDDCVERTIAQARESAKGPPLLQDIHRAHEKVVANAKASDDINQQVATLRRKARERKASKASLTAELDQKKDKVPAPLFVTYVILSSILTQNLSCDQIAMKTQELESIGYRALSEAIRAKTFIEEKVVLKQKEISEEPMPPAVGHQPEAAPKDASSSANAERQPQTAQDQVSNYITTTLHLSVHTFIYLYIYIYIYTS